MDRNKKRRRRQRAALNNAAPLRQEISAGGIIFRRRQGVAEIFLIKDMFGKWTFPKGKPEPNELLPNAAIRECGEETGLYGLRYIMPLGRTSFRFRRQGSPVQKTVYFFLLEASPDAKEHFKSPAEATPGKEHITEGRWVRIHQVFHVSSYKNSDRLLARALRAIAPWPQKPSPTSVQSADTQQKTSPL